MKESTPNPPAENPTQEPGGASAEKPAETSASSLRLPKDPLPLIIAVGSGACLLLVIVALVFFLGPRGRGGEEDNSGVPLEVTKLAPDMTTSPLPMPSCETIVSSGNVEVAVAIPVSLTVGSKMFPIEPTTPEDSARLYPPDRSGSAAWLCGTVVNYVLGLEPTSENNDLLANLRPGDEIKLQLSNETSFLFRFMEQQEMTAGESSVIKQERPRLTLVVEKDESTWQVATADYAAEMEPIEPPSSEASAQLNQPVRVEDAEVTVIKGYAKRSGDLPDGTMYYLVEFSIDNVGTAPLQADTFSMKLQDGMGNSYPLSPAASNAGEQGLLQGKIDPGAKVQGTAGYLVPDPLAGPMLTWNFSPQAGSGQQAEVSIPHETDTGGAASPALSQAEVSITDAFLDDGGDMLIIEGEVRNVGGASLTVAEDDIALSSSAGIGNLRMAAPQFPWTIEPGESQVIELQYERPEASEVLLELLGYSFEIEGL